MSWALLIPTGVVLVMGMAVVGWRLMRTTGLDDLEWMRAQVTQDSGRPPLLARVLDRTGARFEAQLLRLYGRRRLLALETRLDYAGHPEGLSARAFVRRQAGFIVIGLIVSVFFWLAGQPVIGITFLVLMVLWMELWLRQVVRRRQSAIASELPDFLDVLAVTVTAGLSLRSALERVGGAGDSPLSQEVRRTLDDMRLGMTRRKALEALRARNEAPGLTSWVTAMLQAEELGSPLADALREIAGEVRRDRAARVRRQAQKASPKISLVVTTFIVPASLLLIISSLVLSQRDTWEGIFGG